MTKGGKIGPGLSESDEYFSTRVPLIERSDVAYALAAYEHDASAVPTLAQKRKLHKAREALRLACSVHVIIHPTGE